MNPVVIILCASLAATALVVLGVLYVRYARSPAAQWKRRVRAAVARQQDRLRSAERELALIDRRLGTDQLHSEYFERYLGGLAVEELIKYPGIGPVTTSRLRDAGLTHIPRVESARLGAIAGIGPSREQDIRKALRQVRREAESRFDAGACPEAVAFLEERKRRESQLGGQRASAEQAVRDAEVAVSELEERARIARRITFLGHLFGRQPPGLSDELMARSLTVASPPPAPISTMVAPSTSIPAQAQERAPVLSSTPVAAATAPTLARGESAWMLEAPPRAPVVAAPPADDSPLGRLRVAAGFGLAVAKADGRIASSERKQVRAFLGRRYAQGPELMDRLESLLAEVEGDLPTIGDALWNVRRVIPKESWPELYQFAVSVADAAGERNAREVECLALIAEELGVAVTGAVTLPGTAGILPAQGSPPSEATPRREEALAGRMPAVPEGAGPPLTDSDCRVALEIASDTPLSIELIRRQYRLLTDRFAAGRFSNHGREFIEMAADKRTRAERAARQLLSAYNEPLEPPAVQPPADIRHNPLLDDLFGG
jgi:uncharacterized tellurite resistance protein B-like protein